MSKISELQTTLRLTTARHEKELAMLEENIYDLQSRLNDMRRMYEVAVAEHMHVHIALSPTEVAQCRNEQILVDAISKEVVDMMAHGIEERLGSASNLRMELSSAEERIRKLEFLLPRTREPLVPYL